MILEVNDVVSGYGRLEILHGVSVSVPETKTVALIGPNGAGKSTLLKTIFGYIKPKRGSITFNGEDITGLKPNKILRKGITYVPQGRSVFPYMTVLENLRMGAYINKDSSQFKEALNEVIRMFPILKERKNQMAGTLSGGEQRMLELGRALMLRPKLILLDEPSLGLAPKLVDDTYRTINEIGDMGVTLLIVEQNVRKVLIVADYAYVLDLGKKAFEGTSEHLLSSDRLKSLYLGGLERR